MSVGKRLLVFLHLGTSPEHVTALTRVINLVFNSELVQVGEQVLDLGVSLGAGLAAKVVESGDLGEDVVDNGDDDGDTDGVTPDDNDGDNVNVAVNGEVGLAGRAGDGLLLVTGQPTEDTEEGGDNIDTKDGTNELPRGPCLSTTGDKDEPVLSKSNLEEEDFLGRTEVLDDTTVGEEEGSTQDPGTNGEEETKDDGDQPDLRQLPLDGTSFEVSVIVGNGDGGQVSEQGNEDNQVGTDGLVDDDHGGNEVDLKVETQSNTVLNVGLHTLEDLTGQLDSIDNGGQTGGEENNVSSSLGSLSGTFDSNTAVSLLERGSVVDTVTSHGSQVTTLLQHLDDLVLVLGEDFSETVGLLNEVVLGRAGKTTVDQTLGVVDLGAKSKHLAGFLGNGNSVTSQHLDSETKVLGFGDGVGSVLTRGVEHGVHAQQLPGLTLLLDSNTKRTETTAGEFGRLLTELVALFLTALGHVEDGLGGTLGADVADTVTGTDGSDTLGDRVERSVLLGNPVASEDLTGLGVTAESQDGNLVNGVQVLDVVVGGNGGDSHHPVDVDTFVDVRLTDGELVGGQSTSLVRAEDIDTSKRLDSSELLDNSLTLSEVGGTDSQGGSGDDRKTDGDTNDQENQGVVQQVVVAVLRGSDLQVTVETTNPGSENPEHDENQERSTNAVHDGLEVTLVLSTLHKSSGLTDERVTSSSSDNTVGLTTLATSGVVANVGHVLVDSERFTSDGGLVNSKERNTERSLNVVIVIVFLLLESVLVGGGHVLLVGLVHLGLGVVTDQTNITRDDGTFLDDDLSNS